MAGLFHWGIICTYAIPRLFPDPEFNNGFIAGLIGNN